MSGHTHRRHDRRVVECGIVTVSDTRTESDDTSGRRIRELLEEAGHRIVEYRIVKDEPAEIRAVLDGMAPGARAVIFNGGTGIARRDTTYEAIRSLLEKEIPGFGELFRMLSYEQVGAAAMLSRATAGVIGRRIVFVLPGSTKAVELATTRLILPEIGHLVGLLED
ncbi:MAG TPA: MogA/MoaB family molybdenum cofactor biosynthesis protein [Candidatus Binatia bacterium]|nr:MogA/MoaB family molybdenum cofactor biosynthesis protein [Candidatus Binatia bacterium]